MGSQTNGCSPTEPHSMMLSERKEPQPARDPNLQMSPAPYSRRRRRRALQTPQQLQC